MHLEFIIAHLMKNLYPLQVENEALRACLPQAGTARGLAGHAPVKNLTELGKLTLAGKSAGCPAFLLQGRGGKPTL